MKARHLLYGMGVVLGGVMMVQNVAALTAQEEVDVFFSFNPTIGLELSDTVLSIGNLTPGNAARSSNIILTVNSNNASGYKLLATVGDGDTYTNNSLINGGATFSSLALDAGTTLASMTDNTWGYAKNNADAFYGLPYITSAPAEILTTSAAGGSTTAFAIGAKAASTQSSGEYTNIINFAVVGNVEADSIDKITTMQDFYALSSSNKASVISSMATDAVYTLTDSRDGTEYRVAKLADGKVWMLDNLALGSTTDITLTSSDTNMIVPTWILPASVSSGFSSYTSAQINTDYIDTDVALALKQPGTGKVGVYYNYCAATVGTYCYYYNSDSDYEAHDGINAQYDICPKGWRLPTGGPVNTTTGAGEFQNLRNQYSNDADFAAALHTPLSGYFDSGSANKQGVGGYFWSSTYDSAPRMYRLYIHTKSASPQTPGHRYYGFPVRCVLD